MNNTIWLNAKGCRWSCGGGFIPHCSWSCSGGFGGRRLAEGAAEENAATEEATGEEHVEAVRMNNTIWLNAKGCRWSCGGGLIPHCSWSCSGGFGGRRLAEGAVEENEEHATAVSANETVPLNAKGCRWSCGGGFIPHCSWSCSGGFGGRRLAEGVAEENSAMEEASGEEDVTAVAVRFPRAACGRPKLDRRKR